MKNLLSLMLLSTVTVLNAADITGTWNGVLKVQGIQLRIVFNINEVNGVYNTTMDSPDQGAKDIPTDSTTFIDGELTIKLAAMQIKYVGQWKEATASIEGTFNQGPMSLPLNLSREAIEKKVKPQDPTEFPYDQQEVSFINPKGNHQLAGTLTKPSNGKFDKVAILITGSGPQDRNEELLGHRPFLVLSDYLTRNGIAVLRYDDRGVGESGGTFENSTSADFAEDVIAAIEYLHSNKEFTGKKIGLIGHSEGGMIAPMVASTREDVDFIVSLAGPGINSTDLMMLQTSKMSKAEGTSDHIVEINSKILKEVFTYLKNNPDTENTIVSDDLKKIVYNGYDKFPTSLHTEIGTKEELFKQQSPMFLSDWFRYFIAFEPDQYWSKVSCPVLAINGELDLQVTPKENLAGIEEALKKAGNQHVTIKEFKQLNHLFQMSQTGAASEYATLEETFNEEAMAFVVNWLNKY